MAWVYFVVLAGGRGANPAVMAAYFGGKLIQFTFPALFVAAFDRRRLRPARPTARGMGLGVAFAAATAAAMFALYFGWLAGSPGLLVAAGRIHEKLAEFHLDSPGGLLAAAVFFCVAHSLFEEYYWRWFVFAGLKRHLPLAAAVVLSGAGFMAHHVVILGVYFPGRFWSLAAPLSLGVGVGGMFWAWLYHRSGSLYAPWLSHALIDAAVMAVGFHLLRPGWAG